jgi:hypothetical protein
VFRIREHLGARTTDRLLPRRWPLQLGVYCAPHLPAPIPFVITSIRRRNNELEDWPSGRSTGTPSVRHWFLPELLGAPHRVSVSANTRPSQWHGASIPSSG